MKSKSRLGLIVASSMAAITISSATAMAQQSNKVRIHDYGSIVSLIAAIGKDRGFYEKHGIDAELVRISTGPQANAAMAGGSVDIVLNTPDNMISFKARGQEPVGVVGNLVKPIFVVMAPTKSDVGGGFPSAIEGLLGKQVGVYGLGGASDRFFNMLLQGIGKEARDVSYVALGGPAQTVAALRTGNVAAAVDIFAAALTAQFTGSGKMLLDCSVDRCPEQIIEAGKLGQAYWTTQAFADANPDAIKAFAEANREIFAWFSDAANKDAVVEEMAKVAPAPQGADANKFYDQLYAEMGKYFGTGLNQSALNIVHDSMIKSGELTAPVELDGMIPPGPQE